MIALHAALLLTMAASAEPEPCTHISGGWALMAEGPQQGVQVLVAEAQIQAVAPELETTWRGQACHTIALDPEGWLTPGLVQVGGSLGLTEIGGEPGTHHHDAGGEAVRAAHDVADAYDPLGPSVRVARREGITAAVITPGGGMVAGQAAWVDLWGTTQAQAVARRGVAMAAKLGGGTPAEGIRLLRELLDDARAFAADPRAYDQNRSRSLAAGRMELQALQPVVQGRMPLLVGAHRASDIEALIRFADEERVQLIIAGGAEAWLHAHALAEAGIAVLLNPLAMDPSSFDQLHARHDCPAMLAAAGVDVMISNQSAIFAYHLRQLAGLAVRDGMDHSAAIEAITATPARVFGLDHRGVIQPGARADLVVWTGDPLELSTWPTLVMIAGRQVDTHTRQLELFERYRELPGLPLPGLPLPSSKE